MIPHATAVLIAFCVAASFFTAIGLPLARAIAPKSMPPLGMAPALGWATCTTLALPCLTASGFSRTAIVTLAILALTLALYRRPPRPTASLPRWTLILAATLAILPTLAIIPKHIPTGILLAPPMFDHVKIALVDAILRTGLPVPNPFYGPAHPGHLAYYYLWHFGTAALAAALHISGWTAEAAMTGFTAFASLTLMMGVAAALGGRTVALAATALLALPGSMRPILNALIGEDAMSRLIPTSADLGGWLNQSAWVPQHLASATCVILAALLMLRLAETTSLLTAAALGITVAAGFESSIWIGGIAFAVAGTALGLLLLWRMPHASRAPFALHAAASACLAAALIAPFMIAELHAAHVRGAGGIALIPYPAIGPLIPAPLRTAVNTFAFWPLLAFELPAILPLGILFLLLHRTANPDRTRLLRTLTILAAGCLATAWLLRSTIDNNDLGWRAVLPAILLLSALAGCALERLLAARNRPLLAAATLAIILGVPDAIRMIRDYTTGQHPGDAPAFAAAQPLWQAIRRQTAPTDRIANNPSDAAQVTPWPVNIAWATLSDRPSCYAGWETVIAYGPLPKPALIETALRFARIFDGHPQPGDVTRMAQSENCAVAVVLPTDGAWQHDPFATNQIFKLTEATSHWRIYRRIQPH